MSSISLIKVSQESLLNLDIIEFKFSFFSFNFLNFSEFTELIFSLKFNLNFGFAFIELSFFSIFFF